MHLELLADQDDKQQNTPLTVEDVFAVVLRCYRATMGKQVLQVQTQLRPGLCVPSIAVGGVVPRQSHLLVKTQLPALAACAPDSGLS